MSKFRKNKKDKSSHKKVEDAYLKKLENAIKGVTDESVYIPRPEEVERQRLLRRWQLQKKHTVPVPEPPQKKETPRIPIEHALGEISVETEEEKKAPPRSNGLPEQSPPIESSSVITPPPSDVETVPEKPLPPSPIKKPEPAPKPVKESRPETPPPNSLYDMGAIIKLEDGSIGIYKGPIPGKDYHLLYHLRPDGAVRPEGIYLYAYRCETLGKVTDEVLDDIQRSMRWDRDSIVYHLTSREKARLVPLLSSRVIKPEVSEPVRNRESLERGRKLKVRIGSRFWDAVYWGSDELGQIVAHDTNENWSLMHLNIKRFGDSLEYGPLCTPEEIREINESLSQKISVGD